MLKMKHTARVLYVFIIFIIIVPCGTILSILFQGTGEICDYSGGLIQYENGVLPVQGSLS